MCPSLRWSASWKSRTAIALELVSQFVIACRVAPTGLMTCEALKKFLKSGTLFRSHTDVLGTAECLFSHCMMACSSRDWQRKCTEHHSQCLGQPLSTSWLQGLHKEAIETGGTFWHVKEAGSNMHICTRHYITLSCIAFHTNILCFLVILLDRSTSNVLWLARL